MQDYDREKKIGQGAFGFVLLCCPAVRESRPSLCYLLTEVNTNTMTRSSGLYSQAHNICIYREDYRTQWVGLRTQWNSPTGPADVRSSSSGRRMASGWWQRRLMLHASRRRTSSPRCERFDCDANRNVAGVRPLKRPGPWHDGYEDNHSRFCDCFKTDNARSKRFLHLILRRWTWCGSWSTSTS